MARSASVSTVYVPRQTRAAVVRAASADVEARTVDVVFATEAPVVRSGPLPGTDYEGDWLEILILDGMDLSRMGNAPVLDAHDSGSVSRVHGTVASARADGTATLRISSKPESQGVWQDLVDGIVRQVSVGYAVTDYEIEPPSAEGGMPTAFAVAWQPVEISLVPVGADPNAVIRACATRPGTRARVVIKRGKSMARMAKRRPRREGEIPVDAETLAVADAVAEAVTDVVAEAVEAAVAETVPGAVEEAVADGEARGRPRKRGKRADGVCPHCGMPLGEAPGSEDEVREGEELLDAFAADGEEEEEPSDAMRRKGKRSLSGKDAAEIVRLCAAAGAADKAPLFLARGASVGAVKAALLDAMIARSDAAGITSSVAPAPAGKRGAAQIDQRAIYAARNAGRK